MKKLPRQLQRWKKCKRCRLARWRHKVVVGSGRLPSDIVFVGEGPGKNEDLLGIPFIGRAGKLLKTALKDALEMLGLGGKLRIFITNVVACRPTDEKQGKNRQPRDDEMITCRPRHALILSLAQPKLVILLGRVPQMEVGPICPGAVALRHPAYVLRRGGEGSPEYRSFVQHLAQAIEQKLC